MVSIIARLFLHRFQYINLSFKKAFAKIIKLNLKAILVKKLKKVADRQQKMI